MRFVKAGRLQLSPPEAGGGSDVRRVNDSTRDGGETGTLAAERSNWARSRARGQFCLCQFTLGGNGRLGEWSRVTACYVICLLCSANKPVFNAQRIYSDLFPIDKRSNVQLSAAGRYFFETTGMNASQKSELRSQVSAAKPGLSPSPMGFDK